MLGNKWKIRKLSPPTIISRSSSYGGLLTVKIVENARKGNKIDINWYQYQLSSSLILKIWNTTPEFGLNTNLEVQHFLQRN